MIKRGPPAGYPKRFPSRPTGNYPSRFPSSYQRKPSATPYTSHFPIKEPPKKIPPSSVSKSTKFLATIVVLFMIVGIIFLVIKGISKDKPDEEDEIEKFTADLRISNAHLLNYSDINIKINPPGEDDKFESIIFIFYDNDSEVTRRKITLEKLEASDFQMVFHFANASMIDKISVIPVFEDENGDEVEGEVEDQVVVEIDEENNLIPEEEYENETFVCKSDSQCEDKNNCTRNICSNGNCSYQKIPTCVACGFDSDCEDLNACTANKCSNGVCTYLPTPGCTPCYSNSSCEDNNVCTDNVCMGGRCVYNPLTNCNPSNTNTTNTSNTIQCTTSNQATTCNDNNVCTTDLCLNNVCVNNAISNCLTCTSVQECNDGDSCTRDICSNTKCFYNSITTCVSNDGCCPSSCGYMTDNDCPAVCGNNVREGEEKCDGTSLGGATCAGILGTGYTGILLCSGCMFDTSLCAPPCIQTCLSLGYQCGTRSICGTSVNCGTCPTGYSCNINGTCMNICTPESNSAFCNRLNKECESFTANDNCGNSRTVYCGNCLSTETCTNGQCVSPLPTNPTGDIYYVSTSGIDSSSRDGSPGQEWASLSYACSRVKTSGDMIHVNPGNYIDNNKCDLAVGVSIEGDKNSPPRITTSYTYGVSKSYGYIELNSPAGNAVNGDQSISYINFNGNSKTSYRAIAVNYRSNVKVHHCNFSYFRLSGVTFDGTASDWNVAPQNILPTGNEVHDCVFVSCSNLHRTETNLWEPGHIRPEGQSGMKIYNNVFYQKDQAEGYNADIIAGYQNEGLKLYNNVFHKNDIEGEEWNFFYEMHYHRGGIEIYNNTFYGASTIDFSGTIRGKYDFGARIYNNSFIANSIPPTNGRHQGYIDVETFTYVNDLYIYNNYFKYARTGIHINNAQISMSNIWVYNNIIEGVGNSDNTYSSGIVVESNWGTNTPTPISNLYIYNNVITAAKNTYSGIYVSAGGEITNLNIRNNIIRGSFSSPIRINDRDLTTRINGLNINNNLFYGTSSSSISYSSDLIYINRDDNNNIPNSDPLFVGGSPYNFHLTSSSPARGKGIYVGLDRDYAGQTWNNPPSIGAYEYK